MKISAPATQTAFHIHEISDDELATVAQGQYPLLRLLHASRRSAAPPIRFWMLRYRFGQTLVENFQFVPPCGPSPERWCGQCKEMMAVLRTNGIPLGIVSDGEVEVHQIQEAHRNCTSRPLRVLEAGEAFGLFEICDKMAGQEVQPADAPWAVTAGRGTMALAEGWRKKDLGTRLLAEVRMRHPGARLSTRIENAIESGLRGVQGALPELVGVLSTDPYCTVIVCSSSDLAKTIAESEALTLYVAAWRQSVHPRRLVAHDASVLVKRCRNLGGLEAFYYFYTVEHLRSGMMGQSPLFRPILQEDSPLGRAVAPVRAVLDRCLSHAPILLAAGYLREPGDVGYYSLQMPVVPGPLPRVNSGFTAEMNNLVELMRAPTGADGAPGDLACDAWCTRVNGGGVARGMKCGRPTREQAPDLYALAERYNKGVDWSSGFLTAFIRCVRP